MRGSHTVLIDRPADVVFAYIADGMHNDTWRSAVVEVALHSGDGGEGTVWRQVARGAAGKAADADYRVTLYQPPLGYGIEIIAGPVRGTAVYTLNESEPSVTSVTLEMVLKPRGAMRLLTGFVLRQLVDELDGLDRLRAVLNSGRDAMRGERSR